MAYRRSLRILMLLFGISFVITDLIFLLAPGKLFEVMNLVFGSMGLPPSPVPTGNQWMFLALTNR